MLRDVMGRGSTLRFFVHGLALHFNGACMYVCLLVPQSRVRWPKQTRLARGEVIRTTQAEQQSRLVTRALASRSRSPFPLAR